MKNRDIFILRETLNELDHINGKTFAYAIFKNKAILDSEMEAINSVKKLPSEGFKEYDEKRISLCELHSEKDEDGNVLFNNNPNGQQAFNILDHEAFGKDYEKLSKEYEEVLTEIATNKKEFEEFLAKDSDIQLIKVAITDLPDEISASFLEKIKFILD
jgi:hypothetical protein